MKKRVKPMKPTTTTLIIAALFLLPACVSMQGLTAKGTASLAPSAELSMRQDSNFDAFKSGAPSGLQMLEASLIADPTNETLLMSLAKGYNGYAVAVAETDQLSERATGGNLFAARDMAIRYHTKAVERARQFFHTKGLKWTNDADEVAKGIRSLGREQAIIDLAYVTAHSLKSLVALQKGKAAALTYLPLANALTGVACEGGMKPSYPAWACDVMTAVELAEKPPVAGGDINKAKAIFSEVIKNHPTELMPKALMAQFVLTKQNDIKAWQDIKTAAQDYRNQQFDRQKKIALDPNLPPSDPTALLNAAAERRIEILAAHEKDFF
jgi:hypothetical protein